MSLVSTAPEVVVSTARATLRTRASSVRALLPGVAAAASITVVAMLLGRLAPVIGAPVIAIVGGIAISVVRRPSATFRPGLTFVSRRVLQGSIIVLGFVLSLTEVVQAGERSLPVLVGTLVAALAVAWVAGRLLRLHPDLATLVGVGTAICGASAIAATNAVIDADQADVSYSIATIFSFNVVAVLTYPTLGHLLGLSQHAFGLWAGTAINDMSSVVAASTIYGHAATSYGVIVKLTRTLAIVPIALTLAAWRRRTRATRAAEAAPGPELVAPAAAAQVGPAAAGAAPAGAAPAGTAPAGAAQAGAAQAGAAQTGAVRATGASRRFALVRVFPLFIVGFIAAVVADSIGLVPGAWHPTLTELATWMITAALAAIGLSTDLGAIRRTGPRPLVLGAILWATVGVVSLALQAATGTI